VVVVEVVVLLVYLEIIQYFLVLLQQVEEEVVAVEKLQILLLVDLLLKEIHQAEHLEMVQVVVVQKVVHLLGHLEVQMEILEEMVNPVVAEAAAVVLRALEALVQVFMVVLEAQEIQLLLQEHQRLKVLEVQVLESFQEVQLVPQVQLIQVKVDLDQVFLMEQGQQVVQV
jgi:hypothetical protein